MKKVNKWKCKYCKRVVESTYKPDYKCKCGAYYWDRMINLLGVLIKKWGWSGKK